MRCRFFADGARGILHIDAPAITADGKTSLVVDRYIDARMTNCIIAAIARSRVIGRIDDLGGCMPWWQALQKGLEGRGRCGFFTHGGQLNTLDRTRQEALTY